MTDQTPDPTTPAGEWPNLHPDPDAEWTTHPGEFTAAEEEAARDAHDQDGHDTAGPHHDHTTDPW